MKSLFGLFFLVGIFLTTSPVLAAPIVAGSFSTIWQSNNEGATADNQISFFLDNGPGSVCSGVVYWEEVGNDSNHGLTALDPDCTKTVITFPTPGLYRVDISGTFPTFRVIGIDSELDAEKLLTVEQWGDNQWRTMSMMFAGASNVVLNATDVPNLALVTDMSYMFSDTNQFNTDINSWDVSRVTNMSHLFFYATAFNQPLPNWNVSRVATFTAMFANATSFNQALDTWDLRSATDVAALFQRSDIDTFNYSKTVVSWANQLAIPSGLSLRNVPATYCDSAASARQKLTTDFDWTIEDLGLIPCVSEADQYIDQSGVSVGVSSERLATLSSVVSSTTYAAGEVTKDSFVTSVRRLLSYLTKHEESIANLSEAESTELIILLRDVLRQLISWLPGF